MNSEKELEKINPLAHDLHNIVTVLKSTTHLLKRKLQEDTEILELIHTLDSNINKAFYLSESILNINRENKRKKIRITLKDLIRDLSGSLANLRPGEVSVHVTDTITPDMVFEGVYDDIFRALMNIGINGIEAIEGNGSVLISAEFVQITGHIKTVTASITPGRYISLKISDSGKGISPEIIDKIFQPNFTTKVRSRKGGFGLASVAECITDHSAGLRVTSKPGDGTTFEILLPYGGSEYQERTSPDGNGELIFLAEDEKDLRNILAELLQSVGYEVKSFVNGTSLLDEINGGKLPDLLIIDYKMPGIDGINCIKIIRETNQTLPIILTSGTFAQATLTEEEKKMVTKMLLKPYEFDNLLEVLADSLTRP
ncbi:MAG: response regulator [Ignavibacteriaceae bacterium]|nr:response regulator [Ignavibacteriaceae bacterium]NUM69315.1 response regulator [Ignavibacteriaceae bacterium]